MISLQGGIGARTSLIELDHYNATEKYWKSAIAGSLGIEYFLIRSIAFSVSTEYDSYPFDSYRDFVTTYDISPRASSADAAKIYRFSLEAKFIPPAHGRISLFLITGASYIIERVGPIKITAAFVNGPEMYIVMPGQSAEYWMHTFGLGWRYSLSDNLGFGLTGKLYSNYTNHFHESLMFGFFYVI
jgi:hypothetical protein